MKQRSLRNSPARLLPLEEAEEEVVVVVVEAAEEEAEDKNFILDQWKSVNGIMGFVEFQAIIVKGIVMKSK